MVFDANWHQNYMTCHQTSFNTGKRHSYLVKLLLHVAVVIQSNISENIEYISI